MLEKSHILRDSVELLSKNVCHKNLCDLCFQADSFLLNIYCLFCNKTWKLKIKIPTVTQINQRIFYNIVNLKFAKTNLSSHSGRTPCPCPTTERRRNSLKTWPSEFSRWVILFCVVLINLTSAYEGLIFLSVLGQKKSEENWVGQFVFCFSFCFLLSGCFMMAIS